MPDIAPFAELPEALVEELLSRSECIGAELHGALKGVLDRKKELRDQLQDRGYVNRDSDLESIDIPTTCGVDGSYAIERLLSVDLVACAAVAVEGVTPPSEKRPWLRPVHMTFIDHEAHHHDTSVILRGLMWNMELDLAAGAPHDVVFVDGSLTLPLIHLNPAINKAIELPSSKVGRELVSVFPKLLRAYKVVLESARSDKTWVGAPKYTSRREIGQKLGWPSGLDDRAMLTLAMNAGEFTSPIKRQAPDEPWHLKLPKEHVGAQSIKDDVLGALNNIYVLYYKPRNWTPALRFEMGVQVASNKSRLAALLHAVKHQCGTPGIFEPYPLYMADRMVKHLSNALPTFRQAATRETAELWTGDIADVFFAMHGYRTEGGK